ncbi:hypothetical protein HK104_009069 [Borealophlyctis nickersoniae]|nr:hypothetical protein HK104_009069 [Borealophlyctis nickersoniae]
MSPGFIDPQKDHDNYWKRARKLWDILVDVSVGFKTTEKHEDEEEDERWPRSSSHSGEWLKEGKMDIFQATIEGDLERLKRLEAIHSNDPTYLYQKGAHSRTILHVACLYRHQHIIRYLVENHKALIDATCGGARHGEHAAHILVINQDLEMLKLLVEHGADINLPRASGTFSVLLEAFIGNIEIIYYLLNDGGADPMAIDSHGNTALHVLAWWGYYDTTRLEQIRGHEAYDAGNRDCGKEPEPSNAKLGGAYLILQERIKRTYEIPHTILNYQKFTPMLVAVYRKQRHMVHALLEDTAITEWESGVATCKSYPLTYLDRQATKAYLDKLDTSFLEKPSYCVLELAVRNQDTDLISGEPLFRMLLEAKWINYSKDIFNVYFILALIYAIIFSVAVFLVAHVKDVQGTDRFDYFSGEKHIARFVVEVLLLIINVSRVVRELLCLWRNGWKWRHYIFGFHGPNNLFLWANICCFFLVLALRLAKMVKAENVVLGLAAIVVWVSLLHYTKASKSLGPLVMIFNRMIMWDLSRFIILWGVFFLGFAEALYLQMHAQGVSEAAKEDAKEWSLASNRTDTPEAKEIVNGGLVDWNTPGGALMWMFRWSVGQGTFDDLRDALDSKAAKVFYVVFTILIFILLLNTFIAMLNDTYRKVNHPFFDLTESTLFPKITAKANPPTHSKNTNQIIEQVELRWRAAWAQVVLGIDEKLHSAPLIGFRRTAPTSTSGSSSSSSSGRNGQYHFQFTFREGTNMPISVVATEDLMDMGDKIRASADWRYKKNKDLFGNLQWGAEEVPQMGRRAMCQLHKDRQEDTKKKYEEDMQEDKKKKYPEDKKK